MSMEVGRINFGPAATPTFPEDDLNRLRRLSDYLRDLDTDRSELQEALDGLIQENDELQAEVVRLNQLLHGK
jgi:regulator of replication initiation timing